MKTIFSKGYILKKYYLRIGINDSMTRMTHISEIWMIKGKKKTKELLTVNTTTYTLVNIGKWGGGCEDKIYPI